MSLIGLSQTRKRGWMALTIWCLVGVGFFITFFGGTGATGFATDGPRHLLGASFLGVGFVAYWLLLWITRKGEGGAPPFDERDTLIVARGNQVALVVVLLWVYLLTIGLWTVFESAGQVPVGWMWFLAYGSVIVAFVVSSGVSLILDKGMGGNG